MSTARAARTGPLPQAEKTADSSVSTQRRFGFGWVVIGLLLVILGSSGARSRPHTERESDRAEPSALRGAHWGWWVAAILVIGGTMALFGLAIAPVVLGGQAAEAAECASSPRAAECADAAEHVALVAAVTQNFVLFVALPAGWFALLGAALTLGAHPDDKNLDLVGKWLSLIAAVIVVGGASLSVASIVDGDWALLAMIPISLVLVVSVGAGVAVSIVKMRKRRATRARRSRE